MADEPEIATIEALNQEFAEAFKARDFAALGNMFTNDAVFCPPNSNMITGKGNIQTFWERNGVIQGLRFDSQRVKALGESALRVVGTLSTQVTFKVPQGVQQYSGPQSRELNLKYIFVWQKIDDEWKIESAIWNRIGPARGTFPLPAGLRRGPPGAGPGGGQRPGAGPGGPGAGQRGPGMGPGAGPRGPGMGPRGGQHGGGMMGQGGGQSGGAGPGPGGPPRGPGRWGGRGPRGGSGQNSDDAGEDM
jgi:uncharacterized protein (TIGR02246 family)